MRKSLLSWVITLFAFLSPFLSQPAFAQCPSETTVFKSYTGDPPTGKNNGGFDIYYLEAKIVNNYYIRLSFKVVNYYQNSGMDFLGCQMPDGAGVVSSGVSYKSPSLASFLFDINNGIAITNKNQNLFYGVKHVSVDEKSQFKTGANLPNNGIYTFDMSLYEFSLLNSLKVAVRAGGDGSGGGNDKFYPITIDVSGCKSGFSSKVANFTPNRIASVSGVSTPMTGDIVQYSIPLDPDRPNLQYKWGVPDVNDGLGNAPGWEIIGPSNGNIVTVKVGVASGSMRVEVTDPDIPADPNDPSKFVARTNARTMPVTVVPNPLPVELVRFEGVAQPEGVHLRWSTATEIDNDRFEIERSADGKDFIKIGEVKGSGNSNVLKEYSFKDKSAPAGKQYYRLNQIDFDKDQEYSKVIVVNAARSSKTETFSIYPNPVTQGSVTIKYQAGSGTQRGTLQLLDLNGRIVYHKPIEDATGEVNLDLGKMGLRKGLYLVAITTDNLSRMERILVQ